METTTYWRNRNRATTLVRQTYPTAIVSFQTQWASGSCLFNVKAVDKNLNTERVFSVKVDTQDNLRRID